MFDIENIYAGKIQNFVLIQTSPEIKLRRVMTKIMETNSKRKRLRFFGLFLFAGLINISSFSNLPPHHKMGNCCEVTNGFHSVILKRQISMYQSRGATNGQVSCLNRMREKLLSLIHISEPTRQADLVCR